MENYKLGKIKFKMPSSWQDVSFKTGVEILKSGDSDIKLLSRLSGISYDELINATDFEELFYFINSFTWVGTLPLKESPEMPKSVKFGDRLIIFPHVVYNDTFDLGNASVGMVKDMEAVLTNKTREVLNGEERDLTNIELIEILPFVVAIYLQKVMDRNYDYEKAMRLVDDVSEKMSFKEVLNIGYFFLQKLIALNNGQKINATKGSLILKRLKRAWWNLGQRLVSMGPSIRSLNVTQAKAKNKS
jgi:hypothetical protein